MTAVKSEFVKVDMAAALNPNNAGDSPTVKLIGLSRQRRGIRWLALNGKGLDDYLEVPTYKRRGLTVHI